MSVLKSIVVETVKFVSLVPGDVHLDADNSRSIISMLFVYPDEVYPRATSILKLPRNYNLEKNVNFYIFDTFQPWANI